MSANEHICKVSENELQRSVRVIALLVAGSLSTLLITAAILKPSESGLGTHQQLGLPPCTVRVLFDMRCPGCGMTTSWAHFMRGDWIASVQSNCGGFALAWLAVAVIVQCIRIATGSFKKIDGQLTWLAIGLFASMSVAVADWVWRLIS